MKLTSGVNFINILHEHFLVRKQIEQLYIAFTHHHKIPNAQKERPFICLFMLFGSSPAKAARKTMMKSTPGVNFTPTFYEQLFMQSILPTFMYLQFVFVIFLGGAWKFRENA